MLVLLDVVHLVVHVHKNAVVLYLLGIKLYKLQSSVGEETLLFDLVSFFHDYSYFYGGLKRNFSVTQLLKSSLWTILKNDFEKITFDCSEKF